MFLSNGKNETSYKPYKTHPTVFDIFSSCVTSKNYETVCYLCETVKMKRFILVLKLSVLVCAGKLLLIHPCGISCVLPEVKASLRQGTHWGGRGGGKQRRSKRRGWQPAGTTSPSILTSSQFFCRLMIHFFNKWDTIASFVLGCSHLQLIFSLKHLHHI